MCFQWPLAANKSHPTAPVLRRAWRDVPKQEKKEGFARTACRTQPIEQERSAPAAGRQGGRQKAAGGRRRCAQPIAREKSACATGRQGGRRKAAGGVGGARSTGIPPAEAKAWRQGRTGASGMNTTTRFAGGCHDGLPRLVRFPPLLTLRNPARLFPGCATSHLATPTGRMGLWRASALIIFPFPRHNCRRLLPFHRA